jgi:anion-transporting  ArsA/GET3 family ATPase
MARRSASAGASPPGRPAEPAEPVEPVEASAETWAALRATLGVAEVVICCGSGGVGKTTTAAVLGLQLAAEGRRAVVVTIDPAKRLADALGLAGGLTNDPARLAVDGPGELWAMMLDTAATFDGLVRANAPSAEQAQRILDNRFYRNIAGALSGTQEYMAAERLHSLHQDDRFDVVIVDTPPTRNALDFLEAPGTLARFLDHPLFKLMMMPTRRGLKVLNVAAQPMLRTIGKVVGGDVLADAIAFFQAFDGMERGFRDRADEVMTLLQSGETKYVLVAAPKTDTIDEARYFAGRLAHAGVAVAALVVNRSTPVFGTPSSPRPSTGRATRTSTSDRNPDADDVALWANYDELVAIARAERDQLEPLVRDTAPAPVSWVPMLAGDVHDISGMHEIRRLLFGPDGSSG